MENADRVNCIPPRIELGKKGKIKRITDKWKGNRLEGSPTLKTMDGKK